jgi:hypothetical protein
MADETLKWLDVRTRSARVTDCLRRVFSELHPEALLALRDKRLQVEVVERYVRIERDDGTSFLFDSDFSVWAYFPVHRRRLVSRNIRLNPATRVLLVLSKPEIEKQPLRLTRDSTKARRIPAHTHVFRAVIDATISNKV